MNTIENKELVIGCLTLNESEFKRSIDGEKWDGVMRYVEIGTWKVVSCG